MSLRVLNERAARTNQLIQNPEEPTLTDYSAVRILGIVLSTENRCGFRSLR